MNRFLVTIVSRDGNVSPEKISERLKKIGESRLAIPAHSGNGFALFFLRTQAAPQNVVSELRGISCDPRKPKPIPVISDNDDLLVVEVGENTVVPSEGVKMWLFRK